jgi:hypothetical protein
MSLLLGLHGLPQAEAALIRTIVRLSSSLVPAWQVVDAGECHVVFHEEPLPQAPIGPGGLKPVCVQVLPRGHIAAEGELQRPIRAEALVAVLNRVGARLAASTQRVVAPVAAPATGPAAGAAALPLARLKRWPSWEVLKGSAQAVQLATHLSRAPYSAERLASGTGHPVEDCREFMRRLDALGLLAWEAQAVPPPAKAVASWGLLQSIRRRLRLA